MPDTYKGLRESLELIVGNDIADDFVRISNISTTSSKKDKLAAKMLMERVNAGVSKYLDIQGAIQVSFAEVIYQSLTLSSNSATTILKNAYGDFENQGAEYLADNVPSFEPTISTENFRHWQQEGANTGKLSEMADFQHDLVLKNLGFVIEEAEEPVTGEQAILRGITNNTEKFNFSFTESDLGQELIKKGYKIIEKTGYFYANFWQKRLADQGDPANMMIGSIVTLVSPDGELVKTFGVSRIWEVPLPSTKTYDIVIEAPSVTVDNYMDIVVSPLYSNVYPEVQEELVSIAKSILGI